MQYRNLIITAPALHASGHSEAEIFGSIVWLALQANNKNHLPLQDLSQWLLPVLQNQQFILASENIDGKTRPVAYMSWANLTAEIESRYVDNPDEGLSPEEWTGGDRMWVIDWVTPFGHSKAFRRAVGAALTGCCFKSLYHRGADRGLRVMLFRGDGVSLEQATHWWKNKPILAHKARI
ncbi:toxin-activating lysine-acyltransferase [Limnohabitans sp.]|uniref:toxin-activating lysine-acyltransferase n=1 Tax=Limnohabitans sp. TaxID=1907725 RepID=UPI00286EDED2|nr:toxin-activating lysine-acyltransferase [Limnohabitans sp.]